MSKDVDELSDTEKAFVDYYLLNGRNSKEAYRAVKGDVKDKTAYDLGSRMFKKVENSSYFIEKNREIIANFGLSKKRQIEDLEEIKLRCVQKIPVMTWERDERGKMVKVQEVDEDGNEVWTFDSRGAIAAIQEQNKMVGFHKEVRQKIKLEGNGANGEIEINNLQTLTPEELKQLALIKKKLNAK